MLPAGITPDAVRLKSAPKGWKLTTDGTSYTVGGTALPAGTDAVHSITVAQLPDAKSLVFKTLETYGDGKISRWIEIPKGGSEPENPAPVLQLKPAAPGAALISPSPSPSTAPSSVSPTPSPAPIAESAASSPAAATKAAEEDDDGGSTGLVVALFAVVVIIAGGGAWWLTRRARTRA